MIAPAAILLLLFLFVPVILAFGLSFTNARLISPDPPVRRLRQLRRALHATPCSGGRC